MTPKHTEREASLRAAMTRSIKNSRQALLPALLILGAVPVAFAADAPASKLPFDIAPQPIESALIEFGKQANLQVMLRTTAAMGERTHGVDGHLEIQEALVRLLEGTNLVFERLGDTVTVRASSATAASENEPEKDESPAEASSTRTTEISMESGDARLKGAQLEEIVVTGTHIRGAVTASPSAVYTRDAIDRTALGSVQEFVQRLPQNFNGMASEDTISNIAGGSGAGQNQISGTGVNLRGLGADATLVLINGRRVAPANTLGNWVDVSLIPLAAVDRVEVMPDGASAIYGSDAVGGVVNFILHRDFDGAETRIRYGADSEGTSGELQLAQTLGHDWNTGSALLSYEYLDRSQLTASERSFTLGAADPSTLLPRQERHGVFAAINQTLSPVIELFTDATYAERSSATDISSPLGFSLRQQPTSQAFNVNAGGRAQLSDRYELELSSAYAESSARAQIISLTNGARLVDLDVDTSVLSANATLNASLWRLPAGPILLALGGQYREEQFESQDIVSITHFRMDRDVVAGFVEMQIPLLGASGPAQAGGHALTLALAARAEDYSDFGSSSNPKVGLIWQIANGVKLRGTYGTSFRAPLLNDLDPLLFNVVASPQFDPLTGQSTNVLMSFGGNPELRPEEATTWTIGLDLSPQSLPGVHLSATYYDIEFDNRITNVQSAGFNVFDALRIEDALGPSVVQRNPSMARLQQIVGNTRQFNDFTGAPGGVDLATVGAIVDSRQLNLSTARTSGVDLSLSYAAAVDAARVEVGIDGTYILNFDNRVTSTTPVREILNTPYNPIDVRLRAHGLVQRGRVSAAVFVNYVDSYTDDRGRIPSSIESWTTVDASLGYTFEHDDGFLGGTSILLGVLNIADKEPPFVANESPAVFPGVDFDGANASVLGRFVSLQLSKRWR